MFCFKKFRRQCDWGTQTPCQSPCPIRTHPTHHWSSTKKVFGLGRHRYCQLLVGAQTIGCHRLHWVTFGDEMVVRCWCRPWKKHCAATSLKIPRFCGPAALGLIHYHLLLLVLPTKISRCLQFCRLSGILSCLIFHTDSILDEVPETTG